MDSKFVVQWILVSVVCSRNFFCCRAWILSTKNGNESPSKYPFVSALFVHHSERQSNVDENEISQRTDSCPFDIRVVDRRESLRILSIVLVFGSRFGILPAVATVEEETNDLRWLLASSDIYSVRGAPTINFWKGSSKPVVVQSCTLQNIIGDLLSKRIILLGEHHPERQDHLVQAAMIRELHRERRQRGRNTNKMLPMAVGLEAVQQQYQPILDAYSQGILDEMQLKEKTEWESRWYWSFEGYLPVLKACKQLGIKLVALDISSEDRKKVETGGLDALGRGLERYVSDREGFENFGKTRAYREYIRYTLGPPYELQKRANSRNEGKESIPFSNFVARQMLRDEGMANASVSWLLDNPNGLFVGCIGINHLTFRCGVQGRAERILSTIDSNSSYKHSDPRSKKVVSSLLINPEPLNTGTDLKLCNADGTLLMEDFYNDESPSRLPFVPNIQNEVCLRNQFGLQNYALQINYATMDNPIERQSVVTEAASKKQSEYGEDVLQLSDYLIFSDRERPDE